MAEELRKKKTALRKEMLQARDALTPSDRQLKSRLIQARLFSMPDIVSAQNILFYISFRSEVETHAMIRQALSLGKTVVVPITDLKNKRLVLSRLENFEDDLVSGTWSILEPRPEKIRPVSYQEIDMVITPGAAFCEKGWRIGYGGGFYDRLLRESKKKAYALAFELQIISDVPHKPERDMPVDYIVTEARVICCQ